MKGKPGLSTKQAAFVREYLVDLNGTHAAIRAGYSPHTANEQAARLLASVSVRSHVTEALKSRAERTEIKADDVLKQVFRMTMVDPRMLVDEKGRAIPLNKLPDELAASIQGVEIKEEDGGVVYKYKLADRNSAAEKLMKHLGLYEKDNAQTGDAIGKMLAEIHGAGSRLQTK